MHVVLENVSHFQVCQDKNSSSETKNKFGLVLCVFMTGCKARNGQIIPIGFSYPIGKGGNCGRYERGGLENFHNLLIFLVFC